MMESYETHITVVCEDSLTLSRLELLAEAFDFRVADIKKHDTSESVTILTGRGARYEELLMRSNALKKTILRNDIKVRRMKMEQTLFDERYEDKVDA